MTKTRVFFILESFFVCNLDQYFFYLPRKKTASPLPDLGEGGVRAIYKPSQQFKRSYKTRPARLSAVTRSHSEKPMSSSSSPMVGLTQMLSTFAILI